MSKQKAVHGDSSRTPLPFRSHGGACATPLVSLLYHSPEPAPNGDELLAEESEALLPDDSIQRARIGAMMNFADTPAAIVITAETMNTRFHPPAADNTDASGTSSAAVPFAV